MDLELINKIVQEVKNSLLQDGQMNVSGSSGTAVPGDSNNNERFLKKIFITSDDLSGRLSNSSSSAVELASNEFLTPAAADLVARLKIGITRKPDPLSRPVLKPSLPGKSIPAFKDVPLSASRGSLGTGPVGLITYLPDEKSDSTLRALAHDGIFFTDCAQSDCWMENLLHLCSGINDGSLTLGLALFPFAADALIMANKIPGIRAVQGTAVESVAASVRRLNTNLLVLEHRRSTFHELRAMTRIFVQNRMVSGIAQDVISRIEKLEKQ